jgi:hypothetical protein
MPGQRLAHASRNAVAVNGLNVSPSGVTGVDCIKCHRLVCLVCQRVADRIERMEGGGRIRNDWDFNEARLPRTCRVHIG